MNYLKERELEIKKDNADHKRSSTEIDTRIPIVDHLYYDKNASRLRT